MVESRAADGWSIGKHEFGSRLLVGTGKYADFPTMQRALVASGAEVVTVAVRRLDLSKQGEASLLSWIPKGMKLLPNTAACFTAEGMLQQLAARLPFYEGGPGFRAPWTGKIARIKRVTPAAEATQAVSFFSTQPLYCDAPW
ncbi:MAG: hypothetical protein WCS72_08700, partial [Deltaproteobacteria bacterium]